MSRPTLLVAGKLAGEAGKAHPDDVPIEYIVRRIRKEMPEFGGPPPDTLARRVFIIRSETGSGKSTVLPAYIFRLLRSEKSSPGVRLSGPGVICTQPRILTAQTIARDQAADPNYPDLVMGKTVGYQTGPVNEKPTRGLIYATAGSLLAQFRMMGDGDIMAMYRFIIVDEAHERSLDIDALLMRIKTFLKRNLGNPKLPFVLLASATLPVAKYAEYFEIGDQNVIEVAGRAFEVEPHWPLTGTNDYPKEAARVAVEIHNRNLNDPPEQADILIFMPGKREIEIVVKELTKANWGYRQTDSPIRPFLVLAIYSEVISAEGRDYRLIKEDPSRLAVPLHDGRTFVRPLRRIVVSTVVAETGLTIETLKYVVDCGWSRVQQAYYPGRVLGLVTLPAPQSRMEQRKGRVGRKFPGQFYPLYTQNVQKQLPVEQLPEIIMEGVSPIFLDIVASGNSKDFRIEDIDMLDPPPVDALAAALEEGVVFGYLKLNPQKTGHMLTKLGEIASRFMFLQMHHVQTLLAGYLWHVSLRDLALIVALYGQRDALLYRKALQGPDQEAANAKFRKAAFEAGLPSHLRDKDAQALIQDDFIEALIAFEGFVKTLDSVRGDLPRLVSWCEENGIDFEKVTFLAALREEVMNEMLMAGLNPFWGEEYRLVNTTPETFTDTIVRIKRCIYMGLQFYLVTDVGGTYRTLSGEKVIAPKHRASTMVTNAIRLRGAKPDARDKYPPLLYRLHTGLVSVLDGYVALDTEAHLPRIL